MRIWAFSSELKEQRAASSIRVAELGDPNLVRHGTQKEASVRFRSSRLVFLALLVAGVTIVVAGCGSNSSSDSGSLTLYSAQHEPITEAFAKGFEEENGAEVKVRYGEDEGLASQIEQEGDASPADVVLTENTPPLESLSEKGLLSKVDSSTLEEVPSQYSSPQGDWVGVAARETVMAYNPKLLAASELPASI